MALAIGSLIDHRNILIKLEQPLPRVPHDPVPDMPDRSIAAAARVLNLPLVSGDSRQHLSKESALRAALMSNGAVKATLSPRRDDRDEEKRETVHPAMPRKGAPPTSTVLPRGRRTQPEGGGLWGGHRWGIFKWPSGMGRPVVNAGPPASCQLCRRVCGALAHVAAPPGGRGLRPRVRSPARTPFAWGGCDVMESRP